jgi:hypothetical protein
MNKHDGRAGPLLEIGKFCSVNRESPQLGLRCAAVMQALATGREDTEYEEKNESHMALSRCREPSSEGVGRVRQLLPARSCWPRVP